MRKDNNDQSDCCPDCVNENNEVESPDCAQCCSCCCCSCSGTESESESQLGNPAETQSKSMEERSRAQKNDLLSSLSITRTNRERATIQNVMQFVEALTHSNSFLRRYNLQEDFCLQCLEESFRELYLPDLSRPTPSSRRSGDSCNECVQDDGPCGNETQGDGCLECSSSAKIAVERTRPRNRRVRGRRRSRNPTRGASENQNRSGRILRNNPRHPNPDEPGYYESDCSECRRDNTGQEPPYEENREDSQCECCRNPAAALNLAATQQRSQMEYNSKFEKCADCELNPRLDSSNCCGNSCDGRSNCPESCCESDCEACGISAAHVTTCACCTYSTATDPIRSRGSQLPEATRRDDGASEISDKESEPCNCEECRDSIECSDQSCDECTNSKKKGKK